MTVRMPGAEKASKTLTIAVPAYNVEAYLSRGLDSCCTPDLEDDLEVVVVNDGSTDDTRALAERYAVRWPKIVRVVSKANGGHGSAVNAGLAVARGRYFRVVDGDDWVRTEGLVALIERLKALDCDLVVDEKREVDMRTGATTLFSLAPGVEAGAVLPFTRVCGNDAAGAQIMIHTLTARTDYLRRIGLRLLEHTFYEDFEYAVKASVPAATIVYLPIEVYQYLVGNANQSVSLANYVKRWDDHARVVDELLRYLGACEDDNAAGQALTPEALAYLRHRVHLLVDTHYNIALLFDHDRKRGRARARQFRRELKERNPDQWRRGERRYWTAWTLNRLGIGYELIEKRLGRRL